MAVSVSTILGAVVGVYFGAKLNGFIFRTTGNNNVTLSLVVGLCVGGAGGAMIADWATRLRRP